MSIKDTHSHHKQHLSRIWFAKKRAKMFCVLWNREKTRQNSQQQRAELFKRKRRRTMKRDTRLFFSLKFQYFIFYYNNLQFTRDRLNITSGIIEQLCGEFEFFFHLTSNWNMMSWWSRKNVVGCGLRWYIRNKRWMDSKWIEREESSV